LTEVIDRRHWRKVKRDGNGVFTDAEELCPTCFVVDYYAGSLHLGTPLTVTKDGDKIVGRDQLSVTFEPVELDATTVSSGKHYQNDPATWESPDNPDGLLSKGPRKGETIEYRAGWTIKEWFTENMRLRRGGRWLVADTGEFQVDFDASKEPKSPLDPRFAPIKAQLFAGASYGPLQLTLGEWELKQSLLDPVLRVDVEPLYHINDPPQWSRGVALGAAVHQGNLARVLGNVPPTDPRLLRPCSACTQLKWEQLWSRVFNRYNPRKPDKYGISGGLCKPIRDAKTYEPF
jgi:hypothetical protein